jgi:hypothetical protein
MNPEKEKQKEKSLPDSYKSLPGITELLPLELREKWLNATKKEKNEIMKFYYEYFT